MLKALELFGFKSFADRMRFEFGPGVTAVVGPNGSGKSNVVDGLKWILGEQSPRGLRGKEMTDVIFNGSVGRKPMGMAEASLVFDNRAGILPLAVPEIVLTRRLYRSGESEYLVNGQTARLRDFRELFLGTGAGLGAYSIIEQGKVEQLLSSSTGDRRHLFEEAAGVSRFKAKRIEALRRLDRVEQNLVRAQDIHEELDKQVRSLRAQAGKARNYREFADRLRELRLELGLHEHHSGGLESFSLERAIADSRRRSADLDAELQTTQRDHDRLEAALVERDAVDRRRSKETADVRARWTATSAELASDDQRASELDEEIGAARRRLRDARRRAAELAREAVETAKRLEGEKADSDRRRSDLQHSQAERKRHLASAEPLRVKLHELRARSAEATRQAARLESDLAALEAQRRSAAERCESLARRKRGLLEQLNSLRAQSHGFQRQLQAIWLDLRRGRDDAASLHGMHRRLVEDRNAAARAAAETRDRRTAMGGRMDVIHSLQQRREGLDGGVQQALLFRAQGHPVWRPVLGLLAEYLEVEAEYADLVELALGPLAQALLVRSAAELTEPLIAAARGLPGRVRFLPLDERDTDRIVVFPEDKNRPSLASLVHCDEELRPLVDRLLAATLLVSDYGAALQLSQRSAELRFVTPAGELVEPDGSVSAGPGRSAAGILARHAELRELARQVEVLERTLAEQERRRAEFDRQTSEIEGALGRQGEREAALASQERHFDAVLRHLRQRARSIEVEIATTQTEWERASADLVDAERQAAGVRQALAEWTGETRIGASALAALETQLASFDEAARGAERDAAAHEVAVAVAEERLAASSARRRQLAAELEKGERDVGLAADAVEQAVARRSELDERRLHLRAVLADVAWRIDQLAPSLADELASAGDGHVHRRELRKWLEELRSRRDADERERHQLELRLAQLRHQLEATAGRLRDDYGIELALLWTPEHQPDPAFDPDAARLEVDQLRGRIAKLGPVNIQAVEQLHDLERRVGALQLQLDDLNNAKRHLKEIVGAINEESQRLFLETFSTVRVHFQELFRKLFGGGRADLVLEDESNALESGVEVVARPPGKEPRSLSLLSGGEKTLTAAALLMALFRSKPSPFCILDEVDAALDETNISRFVGSLREFLTDTQFILVTHSKTTMAAADVLHGVTQRESGVSIRVSIRLDDVAEDGSIREEPGNESAALAA